MDPAAAREPAEQAVRYQKAALELSPESPRYRRFLWDAHLLLSLILSRLGEIEKAALAAEELPNDVPDMIMTYVRAVKLLRDCADRAPTDRKVEYEGRAVQVLKKAVGERVIQDASQLERPEFRALSGHPDFQRLILSLKPPKTG
jgi:hypothetical protein